MADAGRLDEEEIKTEKIPMLQPRLDGEDIDMGSIVTLQPADVQHKFDAMEATEHRFAAEQAEAGES
jgi:hypothetical protein